MIKPDIFATIMDFFTSGVPVVNEDSKPSADTGRDCNLQVALGIYFNKINRPFSIRCLQVLMNLNLSPQPHQTTMMKLLL